MNFRIILFYVLLIPFYYINSFAQTSDIIIPYDIPQEIEQLKPRFHFAPVNQDTTNACWSFSTLSFIESELQRVKGQNIKLAVMFPVYYAFIEKAKRFVQTKGQSRFKAGDLFPTVIEVIQNYGMVPEEVYQGETRNKSTRNHKQMEKEIEELKNRIIENNNWNEDAALQALKEILDSHLGEPPASFTFRGETLTPLTFAEKYVDLPWSDYILVTSFGYAPFDSFTELEVPDNWKNIDQYFNVSLELFYNSMISALNNGFTLAIDGDIKEPGRLGIDDICIIPDYDIPGAYITQEARDYRFDKGVTEDDHLMHVVGFAQIDGEDWFLVKDSWRDAFEGKHKGYFFYHEDYVKLKILAYLVHKDGIPEIMDRMSQ